MLLYVKRGSKINQSTPGQMFIDGKFFCYTLEPEVRLPGVKIHGQTAIPAGEYFVHLEHSPNFGRILPKLMNVPMFMGILIHRGNRVGDTAGCILIGFQHNQDVVWESTKAEEALMLKLTEASKRQVLAITISDYDDSTPA